MKNIPLSLKLLGRYCPPAGYGPLILQAMRNELASYYPHTQQGSLHAFGYMLAGTIEIFPKTETLAKVEGLIQEFVQSVESHVLDSLDIELADSLVETLKTITEMLILKKEKGLDVSIWSRHSKSVFNMLIKAMAVYSSFRLAGKPEPERTVA